VSHAEVVERLEKLCDGWQPAGAGTWTPVTNSQSAPQSRVAYRKTEQTHLSLAVPGLSLEHPDRYALDLLSVILGEGMSSRLFVELRETRGLAYDVHSGVAHFRDCGALVITAGVDPRHVYEAVESILEQLGQLRDGVPEEELEKARRLSTGRLMLRMEDTWAVAGWTGAQEALLGEILELDEVVKKLDLITTGEIRRVANDLLSTEVLNLAVVGPTRGHRRLERLLRL